MSARVTTHVAFLRGVNVGGVTVRSADLRAIFSELGFGEVRTVLASGNVRFQAEPDPELGARIEAALSRRFGRDLRVLLRRLDELASAAAACPFPEGSRERHAYLVFVDGARLVKELAGAPIGADEAVAPGEGVVYWQVPVGETTRTPFAKLLASARVRDRVTTRNLRTVLRVLDA